MGNCTCMDDSTKLDLPIDQQYKNFTPTKLPTQITQ